MDIKARNMRSYRSISCQVKEKDTVHALFLYSQMLEDVANDIGCMLNDSLIPLAECACKVAHLDPYHTGKDVVFLNEELDALCKLQKQMREAAERTKSLAGFTNLYTHPPWVIPTFLSNGGQLRCLCHGIDLKCEHPDEGGRVVMRSPGKDEWEVVKIVNDYPMYLHRWKIIREELGFDEIESDIEEECDDKRDCEEE